MIKLTPSFLLFALLAFIPAKVNGTSEQEIAECKLHDRGDWLSAADIAPPEGNWFACGAKIWQTDCRFMDAMRFLYCDINNWSVQTFGPTLGNPTGDETALVTCDEGQYIQGANFNQWTNLDYSVFANLVVYCNDPAAETSSRTEHEVGCKVDKTESTPAKFFPFRYYMTYAKTKFENSFFNPCEGSLIFIYNCYDGGYMGPEITGMIMVGEEFPVFSDAPVEGWWAQKGSGNSVSYEIFREITTTTETAYETAATESLGIAVSGGFEFVGVSASVEVSKEWTKTATSSISSTFSETQGESFTAKCPDTSESSTGIWFIWQWHMSQPESGGMGISVDTFDFVCTDSSLKPPKCPLGFCLDAECQTCYDSENPDPEDPEDPEDPFDPEAPPQKKKKGCFSGAMLVNVHQKGLIRMDEVQIGDIVRTKAGELSRIYSFSHKDRNALSPYLEVTFQDEHSPLEVTHDHMLHSMCDDESGPCLVPAGDLKAGDKLIDSEGMAMDIQSIRSVQARGLYAPLTTTGDIVVNGVAASTYIVMPQAFQKYFSFEMQAAIQHFGLGMYRTYCTAVGCVHETYNAEGFPAAVTMWFPILDVLGWILDNVFTLAVVVIGYLTWKNRGSKGTGESDAGACHPMKVARD